MILLIFTKIEVAYERSKDVLRQAIVRAWRQQALEKTYLMLNKGGLPEEYNYVLL